MSRFFSEGPCNSINKRLQPSTLPAFALDDVDELEDHREAREPEKEAQVAADGREEIADVVHLRPML